MADYNSKKSILKPVRWPKDVYKRLMLLSPKDKEFSGKVVGIIREWLDGKR